MVQSYRKHENIAHGKLYTFRLIRMRAILPLGDANETWEDDCGHFKY